MRKYILKPLAFIIALVLLSSSLLTVSFAYTFSEINARNVFLKQNTNYTCTLSSAAMMLRRAAIIKGKSDWSSITENSIKKYAWVENAGLGSSFSYAGFSVKSKSLPGGSANKDTLISLLKKHPEGVVLYDRGTPHAVLLTDYTDGKFYCADPAESRSKGRISIDSAKGVTINNADKYWYVSSGIGSAALKETKETKEKTDTENSKGSKEIKDDKAETNTKAKAPEPSPADILIENVKHIDAVKVFEYATGCCAVILAVNFLPLMLK